MTLPIFPALVLLLWVALSGQNPQPARPPDQEGKPQINTTNPAGPPETGSTGTTTTTTGTMNNDVTGSTTGTYNSTDTTTTSSILPLPDYEEPRVHRIRGEVRDIDLEHHLLSMKSKDTTRPYKVNKKTKLLPEGTSLATLQVGDHVSISYVFSHRRRIAVGITALKAHSK